MNDSAIPSPVPVTLVGELDLLRWTIVTRATILGLNLEYAVMDLGLDFITRLASAFPNVGWLQVLKTLMESWQRSWLRRSKPALGRNDLLKSLGDE